MAAGKTALTGIMRGFGYDITGVDVLDAYAAVMEAANTAGVDEGTVKADIRALIAKSRTSGESLQPILTCHIPE